MAWIHRWPRTDGILYRRARLWVPKGLIKTVLRSEHDSKVAGHFGQDKTIELIHRNFWWPKMDADIREYIRSCLECQQDKSRRHRQYGLLSPLEPPHAPWQSIAMDFIMDLPESMGCTELWVVIDRFTKMAHLIPLPPKGKTAEDLARIFAREIWRLHGLPRDIVSDRDSRFTSDTWRVFIATLGIRPRMSTAFHPQTDGQTERVNQVIEAYLRSLLTKSRPIGVNYSRWRSMPITTRLPLPPDLPPSSPTTADTLRLPHCALPKCEIPSL